MYRINKLIIWVLHEGKHGLNIILPLFSHYVYGKWLKDQINLPLGSYQLHKAWGNIRNTIKGEIIMYFQSTINVYSLILHEWWVALIKFMVGPTIHVRGELRIYGTLRVLNNFPNQRCVMETLENSNFILEENLII